MSYGPVVFVWRKGGDLNSWAGFDADRRVSNPVHLPFCHPSVRFEIGSGGRNRTSISWFKAKRPAIGLHRNGGRGGTRTPESSPCDGDVLAARRRTRNWWGRKELNLRPSPYQDAALPLSYAPVMAWWWSRLGLNQQRPLGRSLLRSWAVATTLRSVPVQFPARF